MYSYSDSERCIVALPPLAARGNSRTNVFIQCSYKFIRNPVLPEETAL
jgi:hypothetical protein